MLIAESASSLSRLFQVIELGITTGAIYALLAIGYTLIYGIIELIHLAHGDVFMWGGVICFLLLRVLQITTAIISPFDLAITLFELIAISMIVCALLSALVERVVYRPLRSAPRLSRLLSATGASFVLQNVALFILGPTAVFIPNLFPNRGWTIFGVTVPYLDLFTILLSALLISGAIYAINRTRVGRAMRAVSQDQEAASLMGVNVDQMILITFLLGGVLAGAASVVYAMETLTVYYFAGFKVGLTAFTAAVAGGIGNIYGALLGGLLIGLVQALVIAFIPHGGAWADALVFAVLTLVLIFRPTGLLGQLTC